MDEPEENVFGQTDECDFSVVPLIFPKGEEKFELAVERGGPSKIPVVITKPKRPTFNMVVQQQQNTCEEMPR